MTTPQANACALQRSMEAHVKFALLITIVAVRHLNVTPFATEQIHAMGMANVTTQGFANVIRAIMKLIATVVGLIITLILTA